MGIKVFSLFFLICSLKFYKQPKTVTHETAIVEGFEDNAHQLKKDGVVSPAFQDDYIMKDPQVVMEQQHQPQEAYSVIRL